MKILKKKLKRVHVAKKFFYFLTIILYIILYAYFIYGILKLTGIENLLRGIIIGFFGVWLAIYILCGLITMISKKTKSFIFITVLSLLFCPVFGISSYYINKLYGSISGINSDTIMYTTNLIALKETEFDSSLSIGMINLDDDIEGNVLAKVLIEKENLSNKIELFDDYQEMISALYKGEIGACFVSSNYAINLSGEDYQYTLPDGTTQSLDERVKVVLTYSENRKNQDALALQASKTKTLTEPFTVLIMGVDSAINGLNANQAFNGDTLILVTFNPSTLTATMFSIPRDLYVPIACNNNKYAKINSSAAYGSSCVISTVKQLTDIDIDYYVKINFTGVVELVDALGGIDVDVEEPDYQYNNSYNCNGMICEQNSLRQFGNNMIYVPVGQQTLNGEQALAYARNRHQFALSDIARNQHQQQIIEAMAKKLKTIRSLNDFEAILNTVSHNIETNMTPQQILSFYNVGKDMLANTSTTSLSIKKTYLSYYSLPVYLPKSGMYTSALGYYPESLEAITRLMKTNLGLETEAAIKTFSISYNEEYTTPIVGKGLTGGATLERVKSFIGSNQFDANAWCQMNDITCFFESMESAEEYGIIVDQDAHEGELLKSLTSITFFYSDGTGEDPTIIDSENNNQNNDEHDYYYDPEYNDNNEDEDVEDNNQNNNEDENEEIPSNGNEDEDPFYSIDDPLNGILPLQ